jgi:ABC-type glycerol-3-phosphate transport system permease component
MSLVIKEGRANVKQLEKAAKSRPYFGPILIYAFLIFMALVVLFPFYWMIITSLKSTTEIRSLAPDLLPDQRPVEQLHHRLQFL